MIDFRPRNFKGQSTSPVFVQDKAGTVGAAIGTAVEPGGGTVVVGVVFAIGGGIAGYWAGEKAGAEIYDWGNATFAPLPRVPLEAAR